MLVGDGPRLTIITSGRSVKGGYTTYSSATAGTGFFLFIFLNFGIRALLRLGVKHAFSVKLTEIFQLINVRYFGTIGLRKGTL